MARVTVEDCITKVDNHFELVLLAAQRARNISAGSKSTLPQEDDKNPVLALREIAAETVQTEDLRHQLVKSLQRHGDQDLLGDDNDDLPDDEAMEQYLADTKNTPQTKQTIEDDEALDFNLDDEDEDLA